MSFEPAQRKNVKALVMLSGESGGGKTYSAILLARGLVGPQGKIAFLDTEAGRGSYYADMAGGYDVMELYPPFSPERYLQAVEQAEAAGYDCLIIDSISHEWEGEGGCIEQAEQIEIRTKKPGLHCWSKPKSAHKKLVNRLLRSKLHLIFCARAREKSVQVKNGGRTEIASAGVQPIVERNFPFEVTISAVMDVATKQPALQKCPDGLLAAFPEGAKISVETGRKIKEWCEGGVAVDEAKAALLAEGRDVAASGRDALRDWWSNLKSDQKKTLSSELDSILLPIADASEQAVADLDKETTPIADQFRASQKPAEADENPEPRDMGEVQYANEEAPESPQEVIDEPDAMEVEIEEPKDVFPGDASKTPEEVAAALWKDLQRAKTLSTFKKTFSAAYSDGRVEIIEQDQKVKDRFFKHFNERKDELQAKEADE